MAKRNPWAYPRNVQVQCIMGPCHSIGRCQYPGTCADGTGFMRVETHDRPPKRREGQTDLATHVVCCKGVIPGIMGEGEPCNGCPHFVPF